MSVPCCCYPREGGLRATRSAGWSPDLGEGLIWTCRGECVLVALQGEPCGVK